MKYILYDYDDGTITGFDIENERLSDGWVSVSDEAYKTVMRNNGAYVVDLESIDLKIREYNNIINRYKNGEISRVDYVVVDVENIYIPEPKLKDVISSKISEANSKCKMFIDAGISYEIKGKEYIFTYNAEDQLNYAEVRRLIDNGSVISDIPIKASGEKKYVYVDIDVFTELHNTLIKHKFYNLFYLSQFNAYIKTITNAFEIQSVYYGTDLPEEYKTTINRQIEKLGL